MAVIENTGLIGQQVGTEVERLSREDMITLGALAFGLLYVGGSLAAEFVRSGGLAQLGESLVAMWQVMSNLGDFGAIHGWLGTAPGVMEEGCEVIREFGVNWSDEAARSVVTISNESGDMVGQARFVFPPHSAGMVTAAEPVCEDWTQLTQEVEFMGRVAQDTAVVLSQ